MKFVIHQELNGKFHWKLFHVGEVVAESPEGCNGVGNARRSIKDFSRLVAGATVEVAPSATENTP